MHRAAPPLVLACLLSLAPRAALAGWPHDPYNGGVPVCTAALDQRSVASAPDGAGGVLLTWEDARSGVYDIYAQRLSAAGVPLWGANGVAVCTAANSQYAPQVIGDGSGGAILAWIDARSGAYDVYAQRVNAAGAVQWTADGIAVCAAANHQMYVRILPAAAGGAFLAWTDGRGATYDIYAQRLDSAGNPQWAADGAALCTAANDQYNPALCEDGAGGAIVTWQDARNGGVYDICAQRLSAAGSPQWTADGVFATTAAGEQSAPAIVADGAGGAVIVWQDYQSGSSYDLYGQHLSATGQNYWSSIGARVSAATGHQLYPTLASDGAGGAIVAWQDSRSGTYDVYAQRMSAAGGGLWTADGIAVCTAANGQTSIVALPDGAGGAFLAWWDGRSNTGGDVYAQRLGPGGSALWTSGGLLVCGAALDQAYLTIASDGRGGVIAAWSDARPYTDYDVYAQRIERAGPLGDPEPVIAAVKDVTGDEGGFVKVSWNASYLDGEPAYGIIDYRLWRSAPAASLTAGDLLVRGFSADADEAAANGRFLVLPAAAAGYAWELVGTQAAALLASYSLVTGTTRDSLGGSNPRTAFMVEARAGTWVSANHWFSAPDSGYSADNLAPAAPAPFTGTYSGGSARLAWHPNAEADLAGYRLYRGTSASFVPGPGNLVSAQPDTGHVDAAGAPFWYKLTAVDVHGNESPVAALLPSGTTDVASGAAPRAFFAIASANPARSGAPTTLRFGLAAPGRASLALYDATGRRVRELAGGTREAGEHALAWDGRDDAGRTIAPGLYFVRLETPGFAATRKLVVQD